MRLRALRRNQEGKRMSLMNVARILQHRGNMSKSRLTLELEQKQRQEALKSLELEKVLMRIN